MTLTETPCLPPRRPLAPAALAAVLALAAGCSKPTQGGFQMPPTPIEVAVASPGVVEERFHAVGSVQAAESVRLVAEIDAVVRRLPFREGETVRQGDVIAELDDEQPRAEANRAEAVLNKARATYERTKRLAADNLAPPQDLDNATADLRVAEAAVEVARVRLSKCRILAPFAGALGARLVSPGAWLRAGDPVSELSALAEVKVSFAAPERDAPRFRPGTQVTVTTPAHPDQPLEGIIDLVNPTLDPATRSVRLQARVKNPDRVLMPGMSADVSVVLSSRHDTLTVPAEAVFAEGNQFLVYLVKPDSTVARTPVTLGTRLPGAVEIESGLAAGAQVVRAGHQKLYDGARVAPIVSAPGTAAPGAGAPAPAAEASPAAAEAGR